MLAVGIDQRCLDIFLSPVSPLCLSISLSLSLSDDGANGWIYTELVG